MHGPHHGAQKSIRTGKADCETSVSKFALERLMTFSLAMVEMFVVPLLNPGRQFRRTVNEEGEGKRGD
jgi:hypothetical protein